MKVFKVFAQNLFWIADEIFNKSNTFAKNILTSTEQMGTPFS